MTPDTVATRADLRPPCGRRQKDRGVSGPDVRSEENTKNQAKRKKNHFSGKIQKIR